MGRKKIRGRIIHRCRDEYGEIIVSDDLEMRFLYFGDGVLQSGIRLDRPEELIIEYNQAMMAVLLFKESPSSVLLIGLGGGSLVNFLLRVFPNCAIHVVELRKMVIDLAHDYFLLPRNDPRLTITQGAGEDFILNSREQGRGYDLILVDAFDDDGPARSLLAKEFISGCKELLNTDGIFIMNVWSRPEDKLPSLYAMVRKIFRNAALRLLLAEAYQNAILFGFHDEAAVQDLASYRTAAKELRKKYGVNFPRYLKYLYWQNTV